MPTIVRKSLATIVETRREIFHATGWQVRSTVKVEVAGMRDEDFEVAIEKNILMITGVRPDQNERRAYHQMEIMFGKFEIAIQLPEHMDIDQARAEYKDGFLTILFPKVQKHRTEVE